MNKLSILSLPVILMISMNAISGGAQNIGASQGNSESSMYIGVSRMFTDHSMGPYLGGQNGVGISTPAMSDRQPMGNKITIGKNINSMFGIELSYVDSGATLHTRDEVTVTQRTDMIDFNFVFKTKVNYLIDSAFIKAGPSYSITKAHTIKIPEEDDVNVKFVRKFTSVDLHFGAGVAKNVYHNVDIFFEYDVYSIDGSQNYFVDTTAEATEYTSSVDDRIETYSIGLSYKF